MSNIPAELLYTASHEWIRDEGDGSYSIGITEHAQELLGDMVFIELPDVGDDVDAGDDCAVAESVKAASDIYSPLTGEIVAINEDLEDSPELVNSDSYTDGWLFRVKASDSDELKALLSAEDYAASIEEE
ncbi:glycine cleavage system protein GcvH [Alginatibacterium sediminis]|uniref:Glycine cleavage system H protein n=1 Tax=Alginatibacterium sediminis TaxID=2164068 RepID=A0A420EDC5_9ALTE|nr:glycine cleavage system protein GcvH [Alginatibacterium sediminis]RKF18675.1 glycine cleavage system protein GcvH [Alginatibacterium sediminis]